MVKLVAVLKEDEPHPYETRQLPVNVDKHLTMILQLDDPLQSGFRNIDVKTDLRTFIKNFNILTVEKVKQACMMSERDLSTFLSHMVPCVGCRRSVEKMFSQLAEQQHPAVEPLHVTASKTMFIKRSISTNPTALYKLFYHDVFHMYSQIENLMKIKKNKRCYIHSLEMQKPRIGRLMMQSSSGSSCSSSGSLPPSQAPSIPYTSSGSWIDIWNDLSNSCKQEVVILDCEGILDLMEDYLKRHRFCKDCKSKVARAFGILVDEIDPDKESGYCEGLYKGLRFCGPKSMKDFEKSSDEEDEDDDESGDYDEDGDQYYEDVGEDVDSNHDYIDCCDDIGSACCEEHAKEKLEAQAEEYISSSQPRHIHVCCETDYIAKLMARAEAEISGGNRPERHAKTVDVAQEEVLTCISLYLYERLHKLWRNVKAESQTWKILFYVSIETMRRVFEIYVEEKVGMGKLEALCEELEEEERKQEEKQEKKRQKKKRQKKRKEAKKLEEAEVISCTSNNPSVPKLSPEAEIKAETPPKEKTNSVCTRFSPKTGNRSPVNHTHDLGYSSGCCESIVNSREGSEVTCSDGFCNHEDHDCADQENEAAMHKCKPFEGHCLPPKPAIPTEGSCNDCHISQDNVRKGKKKIHGQCSGSGNRLNCKTCHFHSKLLEMLGEDQEEESMEHGTHSSGFTGSGGRESDDGQCSGDEGLTAEEIAEFEINRSRIREERIVLREKIRKDFEQLCGKNDDGVRNGLLNGRHESNDGGKKSKNGF